MTDSKSCCCFVMRVFESPVREVVDLDSPDNG